MPMPPMAHARAATQIGTAGSSTALTTTIWVAALAWAIGGMGMGLAYSTTTLVVLETAPHGAEGSASAGVQLANVVGTALGTGLGGALVAAAAPIAGIPSGILLANGLLALLGLVGVWLATRMPDRAGTRQPELSQGAAEAGIERA